MAKGRRPVRAVETSIFLVIAFETAERASKTYEMFRDTVRDEMHQICAEDPKLSKLSGREVFFEMMQRWLDAGREKANDEVLRLAKVAAFLELTISDDSPIGKASGEIYEATGKAAWSFYLAHRDQETGG